MDKLTSFKCFRGGVQWMRKLLRFQKVMRQLDIYNVSVLTALNRGELRLHCCNSAFSHF